jgi:hypothetical protein
VFVAVASFAFIWGFGGFLGGLGRHGWWRVA